jgi:hypothetical protein
MPTKRTPLVALMVCKTLDTRVALLTFVRTREWILSRRVLLTGL